MLLKWLRKLSPYNQLLSYIKKQDYIILEVFVSTQEAK